MAGFLFGRVKCQRAVRYKATPSSARRAAPIASTAPYRTRVAQVTGNYLSYLVQAGGKARIAIGPR
jgi:hypothetical protein